MKIRVDEEFKEKLLKRIKEVKPRKGFHVTDLIFCLRKKYFELKGIKAERKNKIAIAGAVGTSFHMSIQFGEPFTEVRFKKDGIVGTVDELGSDYIVEYKTTRGRVEPHKHWILQCGAYCYLSGKKRAKLVVVNMINSTMKVFDIEFEPEEIERIWEFLKLRKKILEIYMQIGEPPPKSTVMYDWECKNCPYRGVCNEQEGKG